MFTGIIEDIGQFTKIAASKLYIKSELLKKSKLGDSVCINGICLSIIKNEGILSVFNFMQETYNRTTLKYWKAGMPLNLERAIKLSDRLNGHIVQGHIDGIGRIIRKKNDYLQIACDKELLALTVAKGSISIDGISLTVISTDSSSFSVGVIPYTYDHTIVKSLNVGNFVNIETDLIGRYLRKFLNKKDIDIDFLTQNGYI